MQNKAIKRIKRADFEAKQTIDNLPVKVSERIPANSWVIESLDSIRRQKANEAKQFFNR